MPRLRIALLLPLVLVMGACGGSGAGSERAETYLRWIGMEEPLAGEFFTVRWRVEKMPLKVHLPLPPEGLFPDPQAIRDSVKDGIFDWTDVAAPGVPGFVFVDTPGEADIPIVWEERPSGDWYVAHCAYEPNLSREFRVSRILVTGRYSLERLATLHEVYWVMLHEMGHALGLAGHSPYVGDVMYSGGPVGDGPSARDRATLRELYRLPIGRRIVGGKRSL